MHSQAQLFPQVACSQALLALAPSGAAGYELKDHIIPTFQSVNKLKIEKLNAIPRKLIPTDKGAESILMN